MNWGPALFGGHVRDPHGLLLLHRLQAGSLPGLLLQFVDDAGQVAGRGLGGDVPPGQHDADRSFGAARDQLDGGLDDPDERAVRIVLLLQGTASSLRWTANASKSTLVRVSCAGGRPRPCTPPASCTLTLLSNRSRWPAMRLVGELDLATVSVLTTLIEQQIATGHLDVHIDLSDLAFCDARGLRGLLDGHRRLASAGGRLTLTATRPLLCRVAVLIGVAAELGWLVEPAPAPAV